MFGYVLNVKQCYMDVNLRTDGRSRIASARKYAQWYGLGQNLQTFLDKKLQDLLICSLIMWAKFTFLAGIHCTIDHHHYIAVLSRLAASTLVTFLCCQQLSRLLSLHVTLASFSMQGWQCLLMSLHSVDPDFFNSNSYVHSPGHSLRKLLKHWSRCLHLAVWTTATRLCMEWPIMSWGESSRCRILQHASSPEPDVVTTLRRCYVNYTGFLFGSEWSSNLPVWCTRHCAVKCLSTWLMTSILSPKATGDPFGVCLITCARCHVRATALERVNRVEVNCVNWIHTVPKRL